MIPLKDMPPDVRCAFPEVVLTIFPNNTYAIDNEVEFIEHAKLRLGDLMFTEKMTKTYGAWSYVILQMSGVIEKHIQALQDLRVQNIVNSEANIEHEKIIHAMIVILIELIERVDDIESFSFPYFDRLLELTHSPALLRSMTTLAFSALLKKKENKEIVIQASSLFFYMTPFMKLLRGFDWNNRIMIEKVSAMINSQENKGHVSETAKELILKTLEYGNTIIQTVEEDFLLLSLRDKHSFVSHLSKAICERNNLSQAQNEQKYYQALGEAALVFHLLEPKVDEIFLADMTIMQNFQGIFIRTLKKEKLPPKLQAFPQDLFPSQFNNILHDSIVDIILEKTREIERKKDGPIEDIIKEIEILVLYFTEITENSQLFVMLADVDKQRGDFHKFLKKLFCVDENLSTTDKGALPPILEIWDTVIPLYKRYYTAVTDENPDVFGKLSYLPKDKVNLLTCYLFVIATCNTKEMMQITTDENGELQTVFYEDYYLTLNIIFGRILHIVETLDFETNYFSVIVLSELFYALQEVATHKCSAYLQIPLKITKKMESFLQWSYTPEFIAFFEKLPNPAFVNNIIFMNLEFILGVVYFGEDEELEPEAKNEYLAYQSTFQTIDFITSKNGSQQDFTNQFALRSHEQFVRYYIAFHLNSQTLCDTQEDADQILFYTFERLNQVWRLILDYSKYEHYTAIEFYETIRVIDFLERDRQESRYYKVFTSEVLSALYTKCFLNLSIDYDLRDDDHLANVLNSLLNHNLDKYLAFLANLADCLKKNFDMILEKSRELQTLFEQNDPSFGRTYFWTEYKVFNFAHRLTDVFGNLEELTNSFGKSSALQEAVTDGLANLLVSPILYFIEAEFIDFLPAIQRLPIFPAIIDRTLKQYTAKIPDLVNLVVSELEKGDQMNPTLKKKLGFLNHQNGLIPNFFIDTYRENIRDIYTINSKLFPMVALSALGIFQDKLTIPSSTRVRFAQDLLPDLRETTRQIVYMASMSLKYFIKNPEASDFVGNFIINDQFAHFGATTLSEYQKTKMSVLVEMIVEQVDTRTEEENFFIQFSALLVLHDLINNLNFSPLMDLYLLDNNLEKVIGGAFTILKKFHKMFSDNLSNADTNNTEYFSDYKLQIKESSSIFSNERAFSYILKILGTGFNSRINDITKIIAWLQNMFTFGDIMKKKKFLKSVWDTMTRLLDNIDYKLLSFNLLNYPNSVFPTFSCLIACYIDIFNSSSIMQIENKPATGIPTVNITVPEEDPRDYNFEIPKQEIIQTFDKFVSKLLFLFNIGCVNRYISPGYFETLVTFFQKCICFSCDPQEILEPIRALLEQETPFNIKIYRNTELNRFRILVPIFYFMSRLILETRMNQNLRVGLLIKLISFRLKLITIHQAITIDTLKAENQEFIEKDLVYVYRELLFAFILLAKSVLLDLLNKNPVLEEHNTNADYLYIVLKIWVQLASYTKKAQIIFMEQFKNPNVPFALYLPLQRMGYFTGLAADGPFLSTFINSTGKSFYVFAEFYALHAYNPDIILPIKLKSLAYLDNSGSRIIRNTCMKQLENFWPQQLIQAWKNNFVVEKDESSKNEHTDKKIIVKETPEMKGKVNLSISQGTVSVSVLSYLKEGINPHSRNVLEMIMKNIASNARKHMDQILSDSETKTDPLNYTEIQEAQIGCLAGLMKNYPELSAIVSSYILGNDYEYKHNIPGLCPQVSNQETFLSFLIKVSCYLYRYPALNVLKYLTNPNTEIPIFIEYQGEPLLLSAYNELIVFQEIIKVLEETLIEPKNLFTTIYTTAIWTILSETSLILLSHPSEQNLNDFKLEIITSLYSLCLKALGVYFNSQTQKGLWKEEALVIYEFLTQLSRQETMIKAKRQLPKNVEDIGQKDIKEQVAWICAVLKEKSYSNLTFSKEQKVTGLLPLKQDALIEEECSLLKEKFTDSLQMVDFERLLTVVKGLFSPYKKDIPKMTPEMQKEQETRQKKLKDALARFTTKFENDKDKPKQKDPSFEILKHVIFFNRVQEPHQMHDELEDLKAATQQKVSFSPEPLPKDMRVRVLVKKSLGWHFEKKKRNGQFHELLTENPSGDFTALIRKIGLENINNLIRTNKSRVKRLLRTQHEKVLFSKVQLSSNKQVTVGDIMNLHVDVDNLAFYNEQSELDKQLILILAQKDFIDTLTQAIRQQAKGLRKALFDEQNLKKARKEEEADEEEEKVNRILNINPQSNPENLLKTILAQKESLQKQQQAPKKIKESEKTVKIEDKKEEEEDDDEDYEEVSDFSDEEEENKDNKEEEEEEENDEDFEDVSDEDEEEEEEKKSETKNQQGEKSEVEAPKTLFEEIKTIENISSGCHTREVSVKSEENDAEDEGVEEDGDSFDEEDSEDYDQEEEDELNYEDIPIMITNVFQSNIRVLSNLYMAEFNTAEKLLNKLNLLPKSEETIPDHARSQTLVKEWVNQVLPLFAYTKGISKLGSKKANVITYFFKYLLLASLDSGREATLIPLLTLHLAGHKIQALQSSNNCDEEITIFLMQYAIRSSSIFFKTFKLSSFTSFLVEDTQEIIMNDEWTLYDLLLQLFIKQHLGGKENKNNRTIYWTLELIKFLSTSLFDSKDDMLSPFMLEQRQKNRDPVSTATFEQLITAAKGSKELANREVFNCVFFILRKLAKFPAFRKQTLVVCDEALVDCLQEEKTVLAEAISRANEILNSESEKKLEDTQQLRSFLMQMTLKVTKFLPILSHILNDIKPTDIDIIQYISGSTVTENSLKEISFDYMKTLELLSKLKEKNYLEGFTDFRMKLVRMIEVPLYYHNYISKLKELTMPSILTGENIETLTLPGLVKSISDPESVPKNKELLSFHQALVSWLNRSRDFINGIIKLTISKEALDMQVLSKFSWVLDFGVKEKVLRDSLNIRDMEKALMQHSENVDEDSEIVVFIRRKHIVEDTIKEFENKRQEGVLYNFKIEFIKEPGVDQGGLKKEWLTLLTKEIFDPQKGLFRLSPNMRTIHPNPLSILQPGELTYFRLAGTIAGLAIKDEIPINVNFSKSFLKLLIGIQPNLNDLEDIEPELMHSLNWMLTNPVADLEMPFTYELDVFGERVTKELIENGANTLINENNKELFVSKMYMAKVFKEVERQVQSFKDGFYEIIPEKLLKFFSSGELEILISGKSEIDVEDLKKYTVAKDLSKDDPLVKWFWEIVDVMDQPLLANLIFFITGSSQVPHGGFKDSPIILIKGSEDTTSLPISHTCFSQLEIPRYESKEQFYEKLILAISEGKEGFHIA